jgi:hypothetical protein
MIRSAWRGALTPPRHGWTAPRHAPRGDVPETQVVVLPFWTCGRTLPCVSTIELIVASRTGSKATISWDLTIDLPVPRAKLAKGLLSIQVLSTAPR